MKVKILRVIEPNGNCWFYLKSIMPTGEENLIQCLSFKIDEPASSLYNEETVFARALTWAHRLEKTLVVKAETVVYETPIQTEVDASLNELS